MAGNIKILTKDNFKEETKKGVTLVDFHADWCGPCRMLAPVLEKVSKDLTGSSIGKLDIDEAQEIAAQFEVTSVPTLILFKDGKEVGRLVGLRDADSIKEFVSSASVSK